MICALYVPHCMYLIFKNMSNQKNLTELHQNTGIKVFTDIIKPNSVAPNVTNKI